jgi:hypothetical protein
VLTRVPFTKNVAAGHLPASPETTPSKSAPAGVGAGSGGLGDWLEDWVTENTWPATITCPARAAPLFGATTRPTVALALPDVPAATAIQLALLTAVQPHPLSVDTTNDSVPPPAPIDSPDRLKSNRHGAAACDSSSVESPTTIAPDRGEGTAFTATE